MTILNFNELDYLFELREELKILSSISDKKQIILKYVELDKSLFHKWMYYLFNFNIKFNITSTNCKKNFNLVYEKPVVENIFMLLDSLNNREITGHEAITRVNTFVKFNPKFENLIYDIIDRDIKIRLDSKTINKMVPGSIPEFSVALGESYEGQELEGEWYVSRKLDGIRCITIWNYANKTINCFSRQGLEIKTLETFKKQLIKEEFFESLKLGKMDLILDGELCREHNGIEDFQAIMKEIRKKDYQMPVNLGNYKLKYNIFDILPLKVFEGVCKSDTFKDRLIVLNEIKKNNSEVIKIVEQIPFAGILPEIKTGWEGLMLRKNDFYKGKRSNDLLKVKEWCDEEYKVEGLEKTKKPFLNDKGEWQDRECVGNLIVCHKGFRQEVGTGISDQQRLDWVSDENLIIGKIITIKYTKEIKNEKGELHLRFPVLKCIYGKERNI